MRAAKRLSSIEKKLSTQAKQRNLITFSIPYYDDDELFVMMCAKALDQYPNPISKNTKVIFLQDFKDYIVEDRFLTGITNKNIREQWSIRNKENRSMVLSYKRFVKPC
ncbi:hypothetical protein [Simkania negevensis]|uniref:Uncharacterized protein n=1 Tax=Simkania negevensis (strain ATCC VR-1471 / DSM 27360 / Z) TaxID=331113 RepID=F8L4Y8_SIMNZ|nr:hypothetical protein [Simkania negevensis]CCB89127.1 unknown protein [Simkania negevensis Z]